MVLAKYQSLKKRFFIFFSGLLLASIASGSLVSNQNQLFPYYSWKLFYEINRLVDVYQFNISGAEGSGIPAKDLLSFSSGDSRPEFIAMYKNFEELVRSRQADAGLFNRKLKRFLESYVEAFEGCHFSIVLNRFDAIEYFNGERKPRKIHEVAHGDCNGSIL